MALRKATGGKEAVSDIVFGMIVDDARTLAKTLEGMRTLSRTVRGDSRWNDDWYSALHMAMSSNPAMAKEILLDPQKRKIAAGTLTKDGYSAVMSGMTDEIATQLLSTEDGVTFLKGARSSNPYGGGTLYEILDIWKKRLAKPKEEVETFGYSDFCKAVSGFTDDEIRARVSQEYIDPVYARRGYDMPRSEEEKFVDKFSMFMGARIEIELLDIPTEELYKTFVKFRRWEEHVHPRNEGFDQGLYYGPTYERIEEAYKIKNEEGVKIGIIDLIDSILHR